MEPLGRLALVLGTLASSLAWGAEPGVRYVGVEDAKAYAVANNFGVQALKAEVSVQAAALRSSRSNFYPKLGVAGGFEVEGSAGARESAPVGFVYGRWNLFNGLADRNEGRRADTLRQLSESRYEQAVNELRLEVEGLFYDYLFKKRVHDYVAESIELNAKHLGAVKRRKASGLSSESDLMDFELRDSSLLSELNRTKQELDEIKLSLVRRLGPELGMGFEPRGELPHWHLEGTVDSYLALVKERSESVRQASLTAQGSLAALKASRAGWMPKLDVEARFGALPLADRFDGERVSYSAGVMASWELFSGFRTSAEGARAEAELRRDEFNAKQALLGGMAEVESGIRKLQSITQRVDIEVSNEARAERLYRSTLAEFGRGVKNGADVKGAEETWLEAKKRRSELKIEFIKAKIAIEKSFQIPVRVSELKDAHK